MIDLERGTSEQAQTWTGFATERRPCEVALNSTHGRVFCALVEDPAPMFWDDGLAGEAFGRPVIPPATLMSYALPLPWRPAERQGSTPLWARVPLPGDTIINTQTTTRYDRPLFADEPLWVAEEVVAVSPMRGTRVGPGHFLTTRMTFTDGDAVPVAHHDNTMLRYDAEPTPRRSSRSAAARAGAPDQHFSLTVTRSRAALNVMATLDLFPGHHDQRYARNQGVDDVYLNTLFFHGLIDRAAFAAAGGPAVLRHRDLRMLDPAVVGDELDVLAWSRQKGDAVEVEVAIVGSGGGARATGWARVEAAGA